MRCAIMQPTYLPWAGYFNLMAQVDFFVFLDDVQFCRGSWHQRNRILRYGQVEFVTLPVRKSGARRMLEDVEIDFSDPSYFDQLKDRMHRAYCCRPFYSSVVEMIDLAIPKESCLLSDFNISALSYCADRAALKCRFVRSSELRVPGVRSDRLENICKYLGCNQYLTPAGSLPYLQDDRFGENSGINLDVQDYMPLPYDQGGGGFVTHLSVLDVVANIGWDSFRTYI